MGEIEVEGLVERERLNSSHQGGADLSAAQRQVVKMPLQTSIHLFNISNTDSMAGK